MPDTTNMFPLTINDVAIYEQQELASWPAGCVMLWRVRGLPGVWFPTRIAADAAARRSFPTEDMGATDARITYRVFAPAHP